MARKTSPERHREWLSLVETSGAVLTVPQLTAVWPHGPEHLDAELAKAVRQNLEVLRDDPGTFQKRWVRWVFTELLDHDDGESLREGPAIAHLSHLVAEHGVTLRPDLVVAEPDEGSLAPRMLVMEHPAGTDLEARTAAGRWTASPIDRVVELCRGLGVGLGMVTDGETWTAVAVPEGRTPETVTWTADLWLDERVTLEAFAMLLLAERFFGVDEDETADALLCSDIDAEEEVTETLGIQVKKAVELLVDTLSRANRERHGELLEEVDARDVYQAAVTVMMRLVFLLSAEERGLFLLGDETYDRCYAVSTLRDQLDADRFGNEESLSHRFDAWHRVLAAFRLVHDGVQHENLRLPPYGGALFDPDRYPFLEGRVLGEQVEEAHPLPIDNRTMLAILDALQVLTPETAKARKRLGEAVRLSFRNLDVEQIGHVYEGLLDHSALLLSEPALGLRGKHEPEVALSELEAHAADGDSALADWVKDQTGLTAKQTARALGYEPDDLELARLRAACDNDEDLATRIEPFLGLLRTDLRGLPQVFPTDSYCVTQSSDRRSSGTYYTPRVLAEEMVRYTLEPLAYSPGPADGAEPEDWELRAWEEIADLKVCDMAMGSGAFLVAACRYLGDRLVEAWEIQEIPSGQPLPLPGAEGAPIELPTDDEDREIYARRLVADRCLYGVDVNPMAVEMAKLSLWLVTLAKDKPFSFVDHSLRCGDSLLGITSLDQLRRFHLDPRPGSTTDRRLGAIRDVMAERIDLALAKRQELESFPVVDVRDSEAKRRLLAEASDEIEPLRVAADALVAAAFETSGATEVDRDARLLDAGLEVVAALAEGGPRDEGPGRLRDVADRAEFRLAVDKPPEAIERRPFHWPLEFPEVFHDQSRFDAVVGNPPFLGGQRITGALGTNYRDHQIGTVACGAKGSADLVAYFFRRAASIASSFGLLATNTIAQGDTSEVGLAKLIDGKWTIRRAESSEAWPGDASLEVAKVWTLAGDWRGAFHLDGREVAGIDEMLYPASRSGWRKRQLRENVDQSFQGSIVLGTGFTMTPAEAQALIEKEASSADVLCPYLGGKDLNQSPTQSASRWIINFFDWPEDRARRYSDCFSVIEEKVRPVRQQRRSDGEFKQRRPLPELYWIYAEKRPKLYRTIEPLQRILAIAQTSKLQLPAFVERGQVFDQKLVVFAMDDYASFGVLSSGFHWRWVLRHGSTMRSDPVYTPSDVFETFPRPEYNSVVDKNARALDQYRSRLLSERGVGLTATYNLVHDPGEGSDEIEHLRQLHVALDLAVRDAYGWPDLEVSHGFHQVRGQGARFTFSPAVADEILERLLELNRERYRAESGATTPDRQGALFDAG